VLVTVFNGVSPAETIQAIHSLGEEIQPPEQVAANVFAVRVPQNAIEELASLDEIKWVEPYPLPNTTENNIASERINVDKIRPAPYNLQGKGIHVGVWDKGSVCHTHEDLAGRVTIEEDHVSVDKHACHVSGTIGGAGNINPKGKGMAPQVHIHSFDWNDEISEMPKAMGQNIVISNHSYSRPTGWHCNGNEEECDEYDEYLKYEDFFGQYKTTTALWDQIVFETGLLVFKSAGNERDDGPGSCPSDTNDTDFDCDGPYDSIPSRGVAKNIVTIGATTDENGMTAFSSWGPTDDGRIKPDLCANGDSLTSTALDNTYRSESGTSMASPSAAGAAALLFEHFRNITGADPTVATMKALMIHGASDLGRVGPDYEYCWGLINAQASTDLITQQAWRTGRLFTGGDTQTFRIRVTDTTTPLLKVTLVWTDPDATQNTEKSLVNDLDLVLESPDGMPFLPWVLGGLENATMMATPGRNDVDNVEQVVVKNPQEGIWTIRVKAHRLPKLPHGSQAFSVVGTGITESQESQQLTVYNDGMDELFVSSIELEDITYAQGIVVAPTNFSIPSGSSRTVTVTINDTKMQIQTTTRLLVKDACRNLYPNGIVDIVVKRQIIVDTDADGIFDYNYTFPTKPNEWEDTDGDGIGNHADMDDDNDDIPDSYEDNKVYLNSIDTNDANEDQDGNGRTNRDEYRRGKLLHLGASVTRLDGEKLEDDSTNAQFLGGVSVNNDVFLSKATQKLSESVEILGTIKVDPNHQGQPAEIMVVGVYQLPDNTEPFFLLDENAQIQTWDGNPATLVPFQRKDSLEAVQHLTIFYSDDGLPIGTLHIFFGYRLTDGTVIYNEQPITTIVE